MWTVLSSLSAWFCALEMFWACSWKCTCVNSNVFLFCQSQEPVVFKVLNLQFLYGSIKISCLRFSEEVWRSETHSHPKQFVIQSSNFLICIWQRPREWFPFQLMYLVCVSCFDTDYMSLADRVNRLSVL